MPVLTNPVHALALVNGAGGALLASLGFSGVVRNAAGDYTLTLTDVAEALSSISHVTPVNPGVFSIQLARPSNTEVRIVFLDALGAGVDSNAYVTVLRLVGSVIASESTQG